MDDPSGVNLAVLVLAHADADRVVRLAESLMAGGLRVIVHADASAKDLGTALKLAGIEVVEDPVSVTHAGWSMVEAEMRLIRQALSSDLTTHVVLVSADSFPLVDPECLAARVSLSPDAVWMTRVPMPNAAAGKLLERFDRYYSERDSRTASGRSLTRRAFERARGPQDWHRAFGDLVPYGGGQWFLLPRAAAQYLLDFCVAEPVFVDFMMHTWAPDETFIHTVLSNSPFARAFRPSPMFSDFSGPVGPRALHPRFVERWKIHGLTYLGRGGEHGEWLFARKFSAENEGLRDDIIANLWRSVSGPMAVD